MATSWGGDRAEYVQDPLERLRALENTDPLREAEKETGKSYKEDDSTAFFGLLKHMSRTKEINRVLSEMNDVSHSMPWDQFVERIEANFYRRIQLANYEAYRVDNVRNEAGEIVKKAWKAIESYGFWMSEDGVLIFANSFIWSEGGEKNVNNYNAYYCWKPDNSKFTDEEIGSCTSSGGYDRFDGRSCHKLEEHEYNMIPMATIPGEFYRQPKDWPEAYFHNGHNGGDALISKMNRMRRMGKFLSPWPRLPFGTYFSVYQNEPDGEESLDTKRSYVKIPLPAEAMEILGFAKWSERDQDNAMGR